MRPLNRMDDSRYSVRDILILTREAGLPETSVISLVNELLNPQSKLLGAEELSPSREAMLEVMHDVGYEDYDEQIGQNGQKKEGHQGYKARHEAQ